MAVDCAITPPFIYRYDLVENIHEKNDRDAKQLLTSTINESLEILSKRMCRAQEGQRKISFKQIGGLFSVKQQLLEAVVWPIKVSLFIVF